jgi:hypothetical protein
MQCAELKTAAEVRALARQVFKKRNQMMRVVPRAEPEPEPEPKPAPPLPAPAPALEPVAPPPAPLEPIAPPPMLSALPFNKVRVIVAMAGNHFGVPLERMLCPTRTQQLADARHIAFYIARRFGFSFPKIGYYAHRDHTTALHGFKKIERRLKDDHALAELIDTIGRAIAARMHVQWPPER